MHEAQHSRRSVANSCRGTGHGAGITIKTKPGLMGSRSHCWQEINKRGSEAASLPMPALQQARAQKGASLHLTCQGVSCGTG